MSDKATDADSLRKLRHDIKNQLSNITLLVGELRHELKDASTDCKMYLNMMEESAFKIDDLLKETK